MRINKLLSNKGICSRKQANEIIEAKDNIISYINYSDYIFPVGRLDKDSRGLILLTNDGDLAHAILAAEHEHEKEYIVTVDKPYDEAFLEGMRKGVDLGGVVTRPCKMEAIKKDVFKITLTQGLNRQIRRMSKHFGYEVIRLERIRLLNVEMGDLEYGSWRYLSEVEIRELRTYMK